MATPTPATPQDIDLAFTAPVSQDDETGGWVVVAVPGSAEAFGTRRPVRVGGTIDGHPFRATLPPTRNGPHMIPFSAAPRETIGGDLGGQEVRIHLTQRFG